MTKQKWLLSLGIVFILNGIWTPDCFAQQKPVKTTSKQEIPWTPPEKIQIHNKTIGAGVILGDPLGVTGKYWLDHQQAFACAIGEPLGSTGIGLYADYLYHFYAFEGVPEAPIYIGGGVLISAPKNTFSSGTRGVVGITYLFPEPFDVFMELCAKYIFLPDMSLTMTLAVGVRFYFQ